MFNSINIVSYNYFLLFQVLNIHAVVFLLLVVNINSNYFSQYTRNVLLFLLLWILSGLPLSIFFLIKLIFIFKINSNVILIHTIFIIINTLIIILYFNWLISIDLSNNKTKLNISYYKILLLVIFISINFVFNMLMFYFI